MKDYPTTSDYRDYILSCVPYITDKNIKNVTSTRPKEHFVNLEDVLPIDILDDIFLDFAIRNNLIIVTCDIQFVLDNLLKSRNVIYQNSYGIRFYFTSKESKILKITKPTRLRKLLDSIKGKQTTKYITDSYKVYSEFHDLNMVYVYDYMKYLQAYNRNSKEMRIIDYALAHSLTVITKSKYLCLRSLFQLKKCVYVDRDNHLHEIIVDYFEFERVKESENSMPSFNFQRKDILQDNIRFIRNYITIIQKNLNYIESELLKRKELEASPKPSEPLQVPTTTTGVQTLDQTSEADTFE